MIQKSLDDVVIDGTGQMVKQINNDIVADFYLKAQNALVDKYNFNEQNWGYPVSRNKEQQHRIDQLSEQNENRLDQLYSGIFDPKRYESGIQLLTFRKKPLKKKDVLSIIEEAENQKGTLMLTQPLKTDSQTSRKKLTLSKDIVRLQNLRH